MMIITKDDILRISILDGRPIPDIRIIHACFGLNHPIEKRCFNCELIKSCLIYTAEFFELETEERNEDTLKAEVLRIWDTRGKLEEKLEFRINEAIKTANKSLSKDIVQPTAKKDTATYYAELFYLKIGGTISECAKYVERFKPCNAYKL